MGVSITYLITGGTGTLGTALTLHLLGQGHKVRTYSRHEHGIERLEAKVPESERPRLSAMVGDVRDVDRLTRAANGADVVIHAAALKIIPICEYNPDETVKTNLVGTLNVVTACLRARVARAILISTDKASAPVNLYGATKLAAERTWLSAKAIAAGRGTKFVAVRYGNVWASAGSVIHKFLAQRETGTFTVTDRGMTRFHLRLPEAIHWVEYGLSYLEPGELVVPKLPSYSVIDLAYAVRSDAMIHFAGRRPGEKLAESLISPHESCYAQEHERHYVLRPHEVQQQGGWEYTSSTNQWRLGRAELAKEIECLERS